MTDSIEMPEGRFVRHALALLANDDDTVRTFIPILEPEYFEAPEVKWVVRQVIHRWQTRKQAAGVEWLRDRYESLDKVKLGQMSQGLLERVLDDLEHPPTGKTKQAVLADLESVLRRGALKHAIVTAAERFDTGDEEAAFKLMEDAKNVRLARDKWTMIPPDDLGAFLQRRNPDLLRELSVPTGFRTLDDWLAGGLRPGELGVWLATTGRGKSMLLATMGVRALGKGLNVVHFSFENSEDETEVRYMANMTNVAIEDIGDLSKKQLRKKMDVVSGQGYMLLLPGSKTDCDMLSTYLTRLEEQGIEIGLIIVDYGDLMRSTFKHERKYDEQESVFEELRELAMVHKAPLWTGTQGNRKALEDPWIDLRHIAESFGKAFKADIVLAKCEGRPDQHEQYHCDSFIRVCKFRRGTPDRTIAIKEHLGRARFEDCGKVEADHSRRMERDDGPASTSDAAES